MKLRKIAFLAAATTSGLVLSTMAGPAASAAEEPVTFSVEEGVLALDQTPSTGTVLVEGTAVAMPVTTVTDGRNQASRTGSWTITATASDLVADAGGVDEATIAGSDITLDETGSFTSGSGTLVDPVAVVGTGTLQSVTANSIESVYTYTPTATLATQTLPFSGAYTGTVTQTVV